MESMNSDENQRHATAGAAALARNVAAIFVLALVALAVCLPCNTAAAQPKIIDLGPTDTIGGGLLDLNNAAQIVGRYPLVGPIGNLSFEWENGSFTTLAVPSGTCNSLVTAISETGVIA